MTTDIIGASDTLKIEVTKKNKDVEIPKWVRIYVQNLSKMTELTLNGKR